MSNLHNGFYSYSSTCGGFNPLKEVRSLGTEEDWQVIEELNFEVLINLPTSYSFFSNGAGDHLVTDYQNPEKATSWYHDDTPLYNCNFWEEIDDRILANLEY